MANIVPFVPVTPDTLGGDNIPSWATNFFKQYNDCGIAQSAALAGGLVLGQNIAGMRSPATGYTTVQTGSKYSSGQFTPISFRWLAGQYKNPDIVQIGYSQAQNGTIGSVPVGIPVGGWSYSATTGAITINYITGLANSTTYYFTFLAS